MSHILRNIVNNEKPMVKYRCDLYESIGFIIYE